MGRGLAASGTAVVTGSTSSGDHPRVIELGSGENLGGMAGVATQRRCDVLLRFDDIVSRQAHATGMATGTVPRRTLEDAAGMARLATRGSVRASQGITSCQMVKFGRRVLRLQTCAESDTQKCQYQTRNAGKKIRTI